jgi:hypothetical protein
MNARIRRREKRQLRTRRRLAPCEGQDLVDPLASGSTCSCSVAVFMSQGEARSVLRCAVTVFCVVIFANSAFAWNSIGHLVVAKLAFEQLDDKDRATLFQLLKHHPHYSTFLAASQPPTIDEPEWVILRAAIWPDWVRPRNGQETRGESVTKYHRPEDHYINVPFVDPKDVAAFDGKTLIDPDATNVLCALRHRCSELRLKTASAEDKAIALCWILHQIGDIHQPLHNVAYFADNEPFRHGDQGGNKFGIRVNGSGHRLHTYWDDLLGQDEHPTDDSADHQQKIVQQAVDVAVRLRNLKLQPTDAENLAKNKTFESWSQEGVEIAKSFAYQQSDGKGILAGVEVPFNGPVPPNAPAVGREYDARAHVIAEVRVVLAGRRLSERMKTLLRE